MKSVQLAHGSGGQAMQQLIGDLFMQAFANPGWRSRKIRRVSIWRRLPPRGSSRLLHRQLCD